MRKISTNITLIILVAVLTGCAGTTAAAAVNAGSTAVTMSETVQDQTNDTSVDTTINMETTTSVEIVSAEPVEADYDNDDLTISTIDADTTLINLQGDTATVEGSGVTVEGTVVTITAGGTYALEGTLYGQVFVETEDEDTVFVLLNGVDITNSTGSPIFVSNAEKIVLTLAENTKNTIRDGDTYAELDESDEPDAALFSKDDLTINGAGELIIEAKYNNGIASKNDLLIVSGMISVTSVNDGIKAKDSITILDGVVTVNASADGIETTNADEEGKGTILIEGGTLNITAELDGIHAQTILQINGGSLNIVTGGGAQNNSTQGGSIWGERLNDNPVETATDSAKGLKAGLALTIAGGTCSINSADDSLHSNGTITLYGGDMILASGDDGAHADSVITINAGNITISQSYEGLESAVITINNGYVDITASDDGINAGGGADASALGSRPGQNTFNTSGGSWVYINGGTIYINANGDGLDSNGSIEMTGGRVIVNGPTNNGNGPLDYMGTFNISGGFLIAAGSSGIAQAPSETSNQYSVLYNFDTEQAAGTLIHVESTSGEDILTFSPAKTYQSILFSTAELQNGETYTIYAGGSATGSETNGLYTEGAYTPGTEVVSLAISSMVTGGGAWGGMMGGGMPGGDRGGGRH